jgi:Fur family transcriptional regulator, peroxide stress response regulator
MEDFLAVFRDRCKRHGLAFTHQRQVIYQALLAAKDHPTPEAIYDIVRERIPSISLGTVYKNIKTFLDVDMLCEVSLHHGSLRLDANLHAHHHLVCRICRSITDLDESEMEPARFTGKFPRGFRVQRQNVEIIGICAPCAQKQSSKKQSSN